MIDTLLHGTVPIPVLLLAVLGLLLAALVVVIWSIKRHRDPKLKVDCELPLTKLVSSLAGLSQGALIEGNSVELFENGAFFDALLDDIRKAQRSVHLETFLWKEGRLGERFIEALTERARAGVKVRVLVDARGGAKIGKDTPQRLRDAGCEFHFHHPAHIYHVGVYNERTHRKLVVIDGRIALLGGHCIVDEWLGDAQDKHHTRDLSVRVHGPAVHALQSVFAENWVEDTGELFVGDAFYPPLERAGDTPLHVASVKCEGSAPAVKVLHHAAVCLARQRLWIQNPYFLPDLEAIDAMGEAVKRGVDVRVMVPSVEASDMAIVQHAAHHNFKRLLDRGVRIFEYERTLLHQKVMTVDGCWCAIGSSNFDDRSFEVNDEITVGFHDAELARRLEEVFRHDMQHCVELDAQHWAKRPWLQRAHDATLFAFNELL
jgi:cardiolipin synthase